MAELAGSLRTAVLRRIRDPNGTAHATTDVLIVLSAAQRLVNAKTRALVTQTTSGTRFARRPLMSLTVNLAGVIHVESVRSLDGKRELQKINWRTLAHYDPNWFRKTATTPTLWGMVGHDQLLVWPAAAVQGQDIMVVSTNVTPALTLDADVTVLPDQHMPAVLDITEQCLLARQRLFASLKVASEKQNQRADVGRAT